MGIKNFVSATVLMVAVSVGSQADENCWKLVPTESCQAEHGARGEPELCACNETTLVCSPDESHWYVSAADWAEAGRKEAVEVDGGEQGKDTRVLFKFLCAKHQTCDPVCGWHQVKQKHVCVELTLGWDYVKDHKLVGLICEGNASGGGY